MVVSIIKTSRGEHTGGVALDGFISPTTVITYFDSMSSGSVQYLFFAEAKTEASCGGKLDS